MAYQGIHQFDEGAASVTEVPEGVGLGLLEVLDEAVAGADACVSRNQQVVDKRAISILL